MSEQRERDGDRRGEERRENASPLQSGVGITVIEETVVARIAGLAAQEVEGVRMGGGGGFLGGSGETRGVSVEVGREETAIDLTLTTEYGRSIPQLAEEVTRRVKSRIEDLTGLRVTEVNITVSNIYFPYEEEQEQQRRVR